MGYNHITVKLLSKQPERWSRWCTLDQYSDLIGFTYKIIENKSRSRHNVEGSFLCVLYFGWPNHVTHNASTSTVTRKRSRRITKHANIHLDHSSVINLSSCSLSTDEISILSRGLTFCPTPRHINWPEVSADIYDFSRRMRLASYYNPIICGLQSSHYNPIIRKLQ